MQLEQNLLFDFDDIQEKPIQKKEPFFLISSGLSIDKIKYGVKTDNMPLTIKLDTITEVRKFLSTILTQQETEEVLQRTKENFDQWQEYKDNSMFYF